MLSATCLLTCCSASLPASLFACCVLLHVQPAIAFVLSAVCMLFATCCVLRAACCVLVASLFSACCLHIVCYCLSASSCCLPACHPACFPACLLACLLPVCFELLLHVQPAIDFVLSAVCVVCAMCYMLRAACWQEGRQAGRAAS